MGKKIVVLLIALMLVLSMAACSSDDPAGSTDPNEANGPGESEENGTGGEGGAVESGDAGSLTVAEGKFTVGFDQNFPPMGFIGDDGSLPDLTWIWRQRLPIAWGWNSSCSLLPGMPRIWSFPVKTSIVSGTVSRLTAAKTHIPGPILICQTTRCLWLELIRGSQI